VNADFLAHEGSRLTQKNDYVAPANEKDPTERQVWIGALKATKRAYELQIVVLAHLIKGDLAIEQKKKLTTQGRFALRMRRGLCREIARL
jgi:hypothetical protein